MSSSPRSLDAGFGPSGGGTLGGDPPPCAGDPPRARLRLVAFDLDGVVWRGGEVLPGAAEALGEVLRRGLDLRYVSNNSTAHRETVSKRLAGMGLPAGAERVLTSGFVTGRWLRERVHAGAPVLVVGEEGLLRELLEAGLDAYHAGAATASGRASAAVAMPVAVVVGMDRSFSYETLAAAQAAIMGGALFVATNRDATFPTPDGLMPGAGAIVAAVASAAEREPVLMGKPGLALAETLAVLTGISAAETLFVGDRLSTDIAMGCEAGMTTVLVLTGITSKDDLQRAEAARENEGEVGGEVDGDTVLPNYLLNDLRELPQLLDELGRG